MALCIRMLKGARSAAQGQWCCSPDQSQLATGRDECEDEKARALRVDAVPGVRKVVDRLQHQGTMSVP